MTVLGAASLFVEALASALRARGLTVTTAANVGSARIGTGGVVVVPGPSDNLEADVGAVRAKAPGARVVVLLRRATERVAAVHADGWVSHEDSLDHVVRTLTSATWPRIRLSATTPRPDCPGSLTAREVEILRVVASGMSDAETADLLQISVHTVRAHLQSARTKLGVANRFAAVALARRAGTLDSR